MKKYYFALALLLLANTSFAEVSYLSFSTGPKTLLVHSTSSTMSFQTKNSSGAVEAVTETQDVILTSTSKTGEFFSSSQDKFSTTMAKGTYTKNFLYKDDTPGEYIITARIIGRTSAKSFFENQKIPVLEKLVTQTSPVMSEKPKTTIKEEAKVSTSTVGEKKGDTEEETPTTTLIFQAKSSSEQEVSDRSWPVRFFYFVRHIFFED